MKLLKRTCSFLVACCIMLSVVCFAGAVSVPEGALREFLEQFPVGSDEAYNSDNKPRLRQYPKATDALVQFLLDVKVDYADIDIENDNSLASKLYSIRIKREYLESGSPWTEMFVFLQLASAADGYKFVSNYKFDRSQSSFDPLHFCCRLKIIDNNGNEKIYFRWIDKEKCKTTVKQMMDGTFDVREIPIFGDYFQKNDRNLLFFKHIQDAVIKYFGDIDSFFNDDEFSTRFFRTMLEESANSGKSSVGNEKMVTMVSASESESGKTYKQLGYDIVTKALEYKGLTEGKDYEIVYDESTGYIKELKKLSGTKSQASSSVASEDISSAQAQLMNNIFIAACILLAVIVVTASVIVVYALIKRKR